MDGVSGRSEVKGQLETMNLYKTDCVAFATLFLTPSEAELVGSSLFEFEESVGVLPDGIGYSAQTKSGSETAEQSNQGEREIPEFPTPMVLMPTFGLELPHAG